MDSAPDKGGFFDLKPQFVSHVFYHSNLGNRIIHLLCIWPLVCTGLLLLHYLPLPWISHINLTSPVNLDVALVCTMLYMLTFLAMEPIAGTLGSIMVFCINIWTFWLVQSSNLVLGYHLWQAVLCLHLVLLLVLFISHKVFEGTSQPLMDSWDPITVKVPLFILLEVLFSIGYRSRFYENCLEEVKNYQYGNRHVKHCD